MTIDEDSVAMLEELELAIDSVELEANILSLFEELVIISEEDEEEELIVV